MLFTVLLPLLSIGYMEPLFFVYVKTRSAQCVDLPVLPEHTYHVSVLSVCDNEQC